MDDLTGRSRFARLITPNFLHARIGKLRRIKIYGLFGAPLLLAREKKMRRNRHFLFGQHQLPRNAKAVIDPAIPFAPWVFVEGHADVAAIGKAGPDPVDLGGRSGKNTERNSGSRMVRGSAVEEDELPAIEFDGNAHWLAVHPRH